MPLEDRAQARVRDEMVGPSQQTARARQRAERKDVLPPETEPDFRELVHAAWLGPSRHPSGVDGPHGSADQEVGVDLVLGEGSQHPDLDCAKASAAGEDKFDAARLPASHLRSEEHTSELQSLAYLVCRLLLAKKN